MNSVLDQISKLVNLRQSMFLYNSGVDQLEFIVKNVDLADIRKYLDYFYSLDPIGIVKKTPRQHQLIPGLRYNQGIVSIQETVSTRSFLSSEYYNDFFRPMKVYYELLSYMRTGDRLEGLIGFYRSKDAPQFSQEEIDLLKWLTPYVSMAFCNIKLRNQVDGMDSVLGQLEELTPDGLLLFNASLKLIFRNNQAEILCKDHAGIQEVLLADCYRLQEELNTKSSYIPLLPKQRPMELGGKKVVVVSKYLEKDSGTGLKNFYMVRIAEDSSHKGIDRIKEKKIFKLTKREVEIIYHIINGEKNAEIAKKLFISEMTVKNHVHSIFQKVQVKNRTSLIRKILEIGGETDKH
jgi:DNA-binding CsgD family transcriptional regulator